MFTIEVRRKSLSSQRNSLDQEEFITMINNNNINIISNNKIIWGSGEVKNGKKPHIGKQRRLILVCCVAIVIVLLMFVCAVHYYLLSYNPRQSPVRSLFSDRDGLIFFDPLGYHSALPTHQCGFSYDDSDAEQKRAFVTILSTDFYLQGVLGLVCSMQSVKSNYSLLVLCTSEVSNATIETLLEHKINAIRWECEVYFPNKVERFAKSWKKLCMWKMVQYSTIVYVDADTLLMDNVDHLFSLPGFFAQALDMGMSDSTHSSMGYGQGGVLVIKPCIDLFAHMMSILTSEAGKYTFASGFAEQDFFDYYFHFSRIALPPTYNFPVNYYPDSPLLTNGQVKIVHFSSSHKPWSEMKVWINDIAGLKSSNGNNGEAKVPSYLKKYEECGIVDIQKALST